jgi:hypothetical protein
VEKRNNEGVLGKIVSFAYPIIISLLSLVASYMLKINYKMPNYDKVLDGAITFSSIVVGFLGALLGILISIKDSAIVDKIFRSKERTTLRFFFYEPFVLGLLVVVSSAIMHVMRAYDDHSSTVTYYVWLLVTVWFIPSTFRVVNTLMSIFFVSNITTQRPQSNVETDPVRREEMKQRLKKPRRQDR